MRGRPDRSVSGAPARADAGGRAGVLSLILRGAVALAAAGCGAGGEVRETLPRADPLRCIAFGSCAKQTRPQPIWDAVIEQRPEVFLFLGDVVYADTTAPDELREAYRQLGLKPGYQRLKELCPVLATWDDHDYGIGDGGSEHPTKELAQQVFLDFFDEPADSPRRRRRGVYDAKVFGPPGTRVQIILLDTRFHRGPLRGARFGRYPIYVPNEDPTATVLGEEQWQWLTEQLSQPARVRILASSIQVLPQAHPFEKWSNFPHERRRLLDLLAQTEAQGVVLLSGDQHLGELSKLEREGLHDLYELTSSGMTHTRGWIPALNERRVGHPVLVPNFGLIEIDWAGDDVGLRLAILNQRGGVELEHTLWFEGPSGGATP